MKKLKATALMLCLTAATLLSSCTKNQDLIVGKWQCLQVEGAPALFIDEVGTKYEFKSNGMVATLIPGQTVEMAYTVSDSTLTIAAGTKQAVSCNIDILTSKAMKVTRSGKVKGTVYYERL